MGRGARSEAAVQGRRMKHPPTAARGVVHDDHMALRRIAATADAIILGGRVWLLFNCPPSLLEYLCALEAGDEDGEESGDAEADDDGEDRRDCGHVDTDPADRAIIDAARLRHSGRREA